MPNADSAPASVSSTYLRGLVAGLRWLVLGLLLLLLGQLWWGWPFSRTETLTAKDREGKAWRVQLPVVVEARHEGLVEVRDAAGFKLNLRRSRQAVLDGREGQFHLRKRTLWWSAWSRGDEKLDRRLTVSMPVMPSKKAWLILLPLALGLWGPLLWRGRQQLQPMLERCRERWLAWLETLSALPATSVPALRWPAWLAVGAGCFTLLYWLATPGMARPFFDTLWLPVLVVGLAAWLLGRGSQLAQAAALAIVLLMAGLPGIALEDGLSTRPNDFAQLPFNDTINYLNNARRLLHGDEECSVIVPRPAAFLVFAAQLAVSGLNLRLGLVLMSLGIGAMLYWAASRVVLPLLGRVGVSAWLLLGWLFYRIPAGTYMTEHWGFLLGLLAMAWLLPSWLESKASTRLWAGGFFAMMLGQLLRPAAFAVTPALLVADALRHGFEQRRQQPQDKGWLLRWPTWQPWLWQRCGPALLAVMLAVVAHKGVSSLCYYRPLPVSNAWYTLHANLTNMPSWAHSQQLLRKADVARDETLKTLRTDPMSVGRGLWRSWSESLLPPSEGYFWRMDDLAPNYPVWTGLWLLGLLLPWWHARWRKLALLSWMVWLGVVFSMNAAMPLAAGSRIWAVTLPLQFLAPAMGLVCSVENLAHWSRQARGWIWLAGLVLLALSLPGWSVGWMALNDATLKWLSFATTAALLVWMGRVPSYAAAAEAATSDAPAASLSLASLARASLWPALLILGVPLVLGPGCVLAGRWGLQPKSLSTWARQTDANSLLQPIGMCLRVVPGDGPGARQTWSARLLVEHVRRYYDAPDFESVVLAQREPFYLTMGESLMMSRDVTTDGDWVSFSRQGRVTAIQEVETPFRAVLDPSVER